MVSYCHEHRQMFTRVEQYEQHCREEHDGEMIKVMIWPEEGE